MAKCNQLTTHCTMRSLLTPLPFKGLITSMWIYQRYASHYTLLGSFRKTHHDTAYGSLQLYIIGLIGALFDGRARDRYINQWCVCCPTPVRTILYVNMSWCHHACDLLLRWSKRRPKYVPLSSSGLQLSVIFVLIYFLVLVSFQKTCWWSA